MESLELDVSDRLEAKNFFTKREREVRLGLLRGDHLSLPEVRILVLKVRGGSLWRASYEFRFHKRWVRS